MKSFYMKMNLTTMVLQSYQSKLGQCQVVFLCYRGFFLRVDNTLIIVIDTRLYHDVTKSYLLREYSERESQTQDLKIPTALFTDENEIVQHLNIVKEVTEKLSFPME